ncbi:MAG: hypothetical protein EPN84_07500 [Legionella sp.]|nr:MAG: hypothetical protein EPN84_07500 [Legionella sp.]
MEKRIARTLFFFCLLISPILFATSSHPVSLTVMTFNIENGGTQVSFAKVVEAIRQSKADVVGLQEPWGNTALLAKQLGWNYYNLAQHIISRFPLYETSIIQQSYTYIEVETGQFVVLANVHLLNDAYGPDLIQAGFSAKEVVASEKKVREPSVLPVIEQLASLTQKGIPVFLVGDFNAGSHLDWTQSTVGKLPHHHYALKWPITQTLEHHGFIDSYHSIHPNPLQSPGYTWPADRPVVRNSADHFNPSAKDIPERIDFIFAAGPVKALNSKIIGESDIKPWPSDHRAVVSQFAVRPVRFSKKELIAIKASPHNKPRISVSKKSVMSGETFLIHWKHAEGNRFDYIQITSDHSAQTCIYTKARSDGFIVYTAQDDLDCMGNKWLWPLTPGSYTVSLMQDDSNKVLASTQLTVNT